MPHEFRPFLPLWWFATVQILGLASAWFARMHQGSHRQASFHAVFFLLLALVGATTLVAAITSPAGSLVTGTTLATMVLTTMEGGVLQARSHRRIEPFDQSVSQLRNYFACLLAEKKKGVRK